MNKQHTQLVDRLAESGDELIAALGQLSDKQLMHVPREGEWSLHENMAHVRDAEVQVFLYRVGRVLDEDAPPLVPNFDQEAWNREHYSSREPIKQIVSEFRRARRKLVQRLRETRDKDWARYAIHPQYGKITLEWLALHAYDHTLEHMLQFQAAREAALLEAANRA